jgi:hypothetical protein
MPLSVDDLWRFRAPTPQQMVIYREIHQRTMDCLELVRWIRGTKNGPVPTFQDVHETTLALAKAIETATAPWPTSRRRELALESAELVRMGCNQALVALGLGGQTPQQAGVPEFQVHFAGEVLDIARDQAWIARWRACQCVALEGKA